MSSAPHPASEPEHDSPHEPPGRPWELELLISGAVIFALLQLPGPVDRGFDALEPQLAGAPRMALSIGYQYGKLSLYVLIASFVLHLAARAYWVGLIGLDTVFPRGVRWEVLRYGPETRELFRRRLPSLPAMIARTDRFCSAIFAFAFMVVWIFVGSILLGALFGGIAWAVSTLLFGGEHLGPVFWALLLLVWLPSVLLVGLDKLLGHRLDPDGTLRRLLRRGLHLLYPLRLYSGYLVTNLVLFSNLPRRAMYPAFFAVMLGLFGFFMVNDIFLRRDGLAVGSHRFLPDDAGEQEIEARFYADQRPAGEVYEAIPFIQSDVIRGPYLKLFIPYSPRRLDPVLEQACPGLRPLNPGGVRLGEPDDAAAGSAVEATLRCWTGVQPVWLNGELQRPEWRLYTDPRTGVRGKLAYLPAEGLPRGHNLLRVAAIPRTGPSARRPPRQPHLIHFWR